MNLHKLQCMTTAMRLIGFSNGIDEGPQNDALRGMLRQAAHLLMKEWNEYAEANGYDIYDSLGKPMGGKE